MGLSKDQNVYGSLTPACPPARSPARRLCRSAAPTATIPCEFPRIVMLHHSRINRSRGRPSRKRF